ncbi:MAG: alanyl-tRNA editing protein [Thermoplasmata archaeon]|uniref:Alanyl-tRNA editing protein n=1 Tax=Candidatus Sysuiplasma superficiale TaxID=2823368 RepID=A0A8J7YME5_9ARCH|nr:alanyl-tRNA editing protein [Candidatus Sysuiplasma superficiale]MBX8643591.1 alanyl-tRNA editing protein [Candidatus Sysuiplasma superficiale]
MTGVRDVTRKLFWEDAYIREFSAIVEEIVDNRLVLDRTAFNPKGGGLPGDTGSLNGIRVSETLKRADTIEHVVDDISSFSKGMEVNGLLDWDRRYRVMRMHTAAHALSAVFNREAGALITGNKIDPAESRIDFSLESLDRDRMNEYIAIVNREILRNPDVRSYFMPRDEAMKIPSMVKLAGTAPPDVEQFRIVEIEGLDVQADGGVHVRSLGELREVVPLRFENKGKANRRIYFTLKD